MKNDFRRALEALTLDIKAPVFGYALQMEKLLELGAEMNYFNESDDFIVEARKTIAILKSIKETTA